MKKSIILISILVLLPFSIQAVEYGFYGRGKDRSFHKEMYGSIHTYDRKSRNSLGLSTELSISSSRTSFGSASLSGGSSGVVYGRTGVLKSSSEGYSVSLSSRLPKMAETTMSTDDDDVVVSNKGFMEPPTDTANSPVGDAVFPLLLFLLPMLLFKVLFRK